MQQVGIEEPVINSHFYKLGQYWRLTEQRFTNTIVNRQRVSSYRSLWIPSINNRCGFGRWEFIGIFDPWKAKNTIRLAIQAEEIAT